VASTGRMETHSYLRSLGAGDIIGSMKYGGSIAACGLAGGADVSTSKQILAGQVQGRIVVDVNA
jgi:hypothetical protein